MIKFSVVMPVFNDEKYLGQAIESILNQKGIKKEELEFIIVNDGSTDSSLDVIKKYQKIDNRIKLLNNPENLGIAKSANKAIKAAKGKYIVRMDSDDISLPYRIKEQSNFMDNNSDVAVCGGAMKVLHNDGKINLTFYPKNHDEIRCHLLFDSAFANPTTMIRRDVITDHNLSYDSEFKRADDYNLWNKITSLSKGYNLPKPLIIYRNRNNFYKNIDEANIIRSGLLKQLGLKGDKDQVEIIASVCYPKKGDYSLKIFDFMSDIITANKKYNLYPQKELIYFIIKKLYKLCKKSNNLPAKDFRKFYRKYISEISFIRKMNIFKLYIKLLLTFKKKYEK